MPLSSLLRAVRCDPRGGVTIALPALALAALVVLLSIAAPARAADPAETWAAEPAETWAAEPAVQPVAVTADEPLGTPGLVLPQMADFRELTWAGGFAELHAKLQREYAFTGWKHIDWPALYAEFAPRIARAQWNACGFSCAPASAPTARWRSATEARTPSARRASPPSPTTASRSR